jgi:uncharacterized protein YkwD
LHSLQNLRAAVRATLPSIYARLQRHRAITRFSLAALALAVALGVSLQDAAAGPHPAATRATSLLPENVGIGVTTTTPVTITFAQAMDPVSVEANLALRPAADTWSQWSADGRTLTLHPAGRWQTDARYVVAVAGAAQQADGTALELLRQVSFTTQTAPTVAEFQVRLLSSPTRQGSARRSEADATAFQEADAAVLGQTPLIDTPEDTMEDASAATGIRIGFTAPMDQADVEARFSILPAVRGSFSWKANELVFTPRERLTPDTRYAVSLVGSHDRQGNRLAGDLAFSFTTRVGAELVQFTPARHEQNVLAKQVVIRFTQPMDTSTTRRAIRVVDYASRSRIGGTAIWNDAGTRLRYVFSQALPRGRMIEVSLGKAARDLDGNRISVTWTFETKAPKAAPAEPAPAAAPAPKAPVSAPSAPAAPADLQEFALWQINQARARHGFAPLRLDAQIGAVAAAHAQDQLTYGYFSHTGRDGSRIADRLQRAGVSFSRSGENMCYYNGLGLRAMLEWCHSTFMSEPYPGFANHIGNILSPNFTRMGLGIAQSGGKVIIVWDFAG